MLYWLLIPLKEYSIFFNIFGYITVRTALAGMTALLISLILGPWIIKLLKKYQIGEAIREDGPKAHYEKKGTPSMGGILIIGATLISTLLWGNLKNTYVLLAMSTMFLFGLLGFWDDYLKIKMKKPKGLIIRQKLIIQILLSAAIGLVMIYLGYKGEFDLHLSFPFFKKWAPFLGLCYLPWIMFILLSSSNSVNLADGLDGLATGTSAIIGATLGILAYLSGNLIYSTPVNPNEKLC